MPERRIWIATRKGTFVVEASRAATGRIAGTHFLGDNASLTLPIGEGRALVALDLGHFGVKLQSTEDAGKSWIERPAPAFPPKPAGEVDEQPLQKSEVPWRVIKLFALEEAGRRGEGALWCGTIPGGLFRSDDGGQSWQLNRPLWDHPLRREWFGGGTEFPGIHSICVDPRNPAVIKVAVSCGGVWCSDDGGASWNVRCDGMWASYMPPEKQRDPQIQDVHRLAQCQAEPDCLWAQHHNGIFVSTDAARTWEELKGVVPSSFGFAVAVHPRDSRRAWFVPAISDERRVPVDGRVCVLRTSNGGESFEQFSHGLPAVPAYDLVYRHGLDVDATGQWLAIGSTTGSLWLSDDAGETWNAVSHHLPPIHAVRFEPLGG